MKPSSLILDNSSSRITATPTYWAPLFLSALKKTYLPNPSLYTPFFNEKIEARLQTSTTNMNTFYLKKFKTYTKLKYSRTPGVDVAASAIAAFLAGLIGFILTEKAGFELLDSGDIFYTFLYIILCVLIVHPYIYWFQLQHAYDLSTINIKHLLNTYFKFWFVFFKKIFY